MATLAEILDNKTDDLNKDLRRAFRPLSAPVDISDTPIEALTILVNLTDRVIEQKNLLDRQKCKDKLRDEKWWANCFRTVKYRQSHNPKFPDIRANGVIRAAPVGHLPACMLSSSKLPQNSWAYANDSSQMNKSCFLTSEFIWNGDVHCLGQLLTELEHPLWNVLRKLGCYVKTAKYISKELALIPPLEINTSLVRNYLAQISLPNNEDSYISLSPVVSQSMQEDCYQVLSEHYRFSAITRFSRATNMGTLAMSCGGKFKMIRSLPPIEKYQHHHLDSVNWLTKRSVRAIRDYTESSVWVISPNKLALRKKSIIGDIKMMLSQWLRTTPTHEEKLDIRKLTERFNVDLAKTKFANRYAYDPLLTQLIYNCIGSIIHSPPQYAPKCEGNDDKYLLLPNLRISGASAMNTCVSIGIPSMMAFYGFVHAFQRNVQTANPNFKIESFAVCIHNIHVENRGLTREWVPNTKGQITAPATRDDWQCDVAVSLILRCSHYSQLIPRDFIRLLPGRIARGKVTVSISDIKHLGRCLSLADAIKAIPVETGRWLSLNNEVTLNSIQDVIDELKNNKLQTVNCIGYHRLETPCEKRGSLHGYKHAFVETILGIIKFLTISENTNPSQYFWQYHYSKQGPILLPRSVSDETS
ncbi:type I-F CRISPR-associated protein Csy2 [Vibrio parahaemolyticus]|uniref:type I-F CRISPR-associated protein Csy2 n=1 Tax=Vibrio parahaemolyticus TaxID=670 RepID=UPI002269FEDF|nr:type I-F CRISPR-associated protein Csy2 [Vibrio parahaemolyticus]MCX8877348.1 type I-F CRISPR-associated protein Csy2 [Vibrio parahaemolyticus]